MRYELDADGTTPVQETRGLVRLSLSGTFGGGTAQLQASDPDGNWVDVQGGAFTDVTDTVFDFPDRIPNKVRVDLTGSTSPALVVWIQSS